jgi:hypothetical protein
MLEECYNNVLTNCSDCQAGSFVVTWILGILFLSSQKEELTGGFAPNLLCFYIFGIIVYSLKSILQQDMCSEKLLKL